MNTRILALSAGLIGLLASGPASAAVVTTYADATAFIASLGTGTVQESFESLADGDLGVASLDFTSGSYAYTISTDSTDTLWTTIGSDGARYLGTWGNNKPLTISVTGGAPTAIGGSFGLTNFGGEWVAGTVTLRFEDNTEHSFPTAELLLPSYSGIVADGASPIASIVIFSTDANTYISMDNLVMGQAIPEPSTCGAIAGALALGFVCWRRRGK